MTAEQRRQAIDFGKIRGTGMPRPQGMIPVASRAHILNLYYVAPGAPSVIFFWRNKNRLSTAWAARSTPANSWVGRSSPSSAWQGRSAPPDSSTQEI